MGRTLPQQVVQNVLLNSKRRCCVCFVAGNDELQVGVIAHLNPLSKAATRNTEDNLVFLCENHHMQYDNGEIQIDEVKKDRTKLYQAMRLSTEPIKTDLEKPWDEFEKKVQAILLEGLKKTLGSCANIYHNRIYQGYSGSSCEVDLSAELTVAGIKLLIAIEIKYTKRKISISDIEAFISKIEDIRANKGVFVTNSGFSESAVRFARVQGIALMQFNGDADQITGYSVTDFLITE